MINYRQININKGVEMTKLLFASLTLAALIFSGCSQKNPEVDATTGNKANSEMSTADKKANDLSGMDANKMDSNQKTKENMNNDGQNDVEKTIAALEANINTIYFDFDKYDIRAGMNSKVAENANILNAMDAANFSIKIEGNSDEWGTDEYNYALGLKRAKSVKEALASYGVVKNRIMMVSYGESNPACKDSNKACWDQNRRVEFKLLP